MKGSYILLIQLQKGQIIEIGSLLDTYFASGYYAYVGSAMGGFKSRLNRHLKESKRPQWHIDYLIEKAYLKGIIICETEERVECIIAQAISSQFDCTPGFGSSDCRCRSHLFFSNNESQMKGVILTTINSLPIDKRIHLAFPELEGQNA